MIWCSKWYMVRYGMAWYYVVWCDMSVIWDVCYGEHGMTCCGIVLYGIA